jgi:putative ABC transport system permease protein
VIGMSGRIRSALIIGGQGIRARKLRTFLSMVSLFLGVLAVVVVQAGASIAERALLSNTELTEGRDGTIRMYVPPNPKALPAMLATLKGRSDAVAQIGTTAIVGEPGVAPINPGGAPFDSPDSYGAPMYCDAQGNCTEASPESKGPSGQAIELQLVAVTGDVRTFRPFRPESGRWLDFTSQPSLSPRMVLNKEAAKGFALHRVPAEMRIPGAKANPTPRIIGVVDDGNMQPAAYVRADELLNWLPMEQLTSEQGPGMTVLLSPDATGLQQVLRSRLVGAGVSANDVQAEPLNFRKQAESQLALMRWIFLGLASLVLVIGVAGILNVGLATVGERVEEFALRRAVGMSRSLLAGIVLAETLLTGLITAGAAIGVGVVGIEVAAVLLADTDPLFVGLQFPWQAGVAGVIAGLVAGLLGGLLPALRAARIPIATVMRA